MMKLRFTGEIGIKPRLNSGLRQSPCKVLRQTSCGEKAVHDDEGSAYALEVFDHGRQAAENAGPEADFGNEGAGELHGGPRW
ncbi:hypothetical protein D3C87_1513200 [compost metagenome]